MDKETRRPEREGEETARKTEHAMEDCIKRDLECVGENLEKEQQIEGIIDC